MPAANKLLSRSYFGSKHGQFLLDLLKFMSEHNPMNMYELADEMKRSYPLVFKSIKELASAGYLWSSLGKKSKHETRLWEVSTSGLWLLLQMGILDKEKVKKFAGVHNRSLMKYFELHSYFRIEDNEYFNLQNSDKPSSRTVAKSLVFFSSEKGSKVVTSFYDYFIENLSGYDFHTVRSIRRDIKLEQENLQTFLTNSQIIYDKLQELETKMRIKNE